jgi:hypothetical protein
MSGSKRRSPRTVAIATALAVSVSLPATALANDRARTETPTIRASVERIAALESTRLSKTAPTVTARAAKDTTEQTGSSADLERGSFFKSPAGIAVIVTLAVGVGYALYSSQNDRIRSTGR